MNGGKANLNGGKNVEKGSGNDMAKLEAGKQAHSPLYKALQAITAGGLSARHRPQNTTASSWPASQQNNSCPQSWPASRRAVQVGGGSAVVLALKKAGSDLPNVPTPPNAFACHCPYPLP